MTDNRHMPHTNKPYLWRLGCGTSENLTWEAIKKTWGSSSQTDLGMYMCSCVSTRHIVVTLLAYPELLVIAVYKVF